MASEQGRETWRGRRSGGWRWLGSCCGSGRCAAGRRMFARREVLLRIGRVSSPRLGEAERFQVSRSTFQVSSFESSGGARGSAASFVADGEFAAWLRGSLALPSVESVGDEGIDGAGDDGEFGLGQADANGEGGEAALFGGFPFSFGILVEVFKAISREMLGDAEIGGGGGFGLGGKGVGQPVDDAANDLADASL